MRSCLAEIKEKAPPAPIAGQPLLSSFAEQEAQAAAQAAASQPQTQSTQTQPTQAQSEASPTQQAFRDEIREMSRDLVLKEQQIEILIASLPGLNTSEQEQVQRMKDLERQLEDIEGERLLAVKEKELMLAKVENKIGSVAGMRSRG